jgi:hypothetical protein
MQELIKSLVKAQKDFKKIDRNSKAYNYKYAPLEVVREATLPSLLANGLTIMQFPVSQVVGESQIIGVKTILAHESGDTIEDVFSIATSEVNPQKLGSLITYFRRYGWLACLGVAPEDEDDDAQSATDIQRSTGMRKSVSPSDKQKKFYFQLLNRAHSNAVPVDLIEQARTMDVKAMSEAIDKLKKQLGE